MRILFTALILAVLATAGCSKTDPQRRECMEYTFGELGDEIVTEKVVELSADGWRIITAERAAHGLGWYFVFERPYSWDDQETETK